MISIRPATPDDVGLICALIRALADYERLSHEAEATPADLCTALFCEHPKVFCDVAEWAGEPVGFALWFYTFSSFRGRHGIYLDDLFVQPGHRGRGLGRALLSHLARRCAAEQLGRLEWAVLDWNAPSIAFYEHLGARQLDGWTVCRLSGDALEALAATEEA
jgi:diamine N-acetyltransferase